ncbi:hypothetical protein VCCP1035_1389B, partial [Vibrio cholerae CP1035(8)]
QPSVQSLQKYRGNNRIIYLLGERHPQSIGLAV